MIRIGIPFQFKIYLLLFILFSVLLHVTTIRINGIISNKFLLDETIEFQELQTSFYNLLDSKIQLLKNNAKMLAEQVSLRLALENQDDASQINEILLNAVSQMHHFPIIVVTNISGEVLGETFSGDLQHSTSGNQELPDPLKPDHSKLTLLPHGRVMLSYRMLEITGALTLHMLSSVPIYSLTDSKTIIGLLSLALPVNQQFAASLIMGSQFETAFIFNQQIVASTLNPDTKDLLDAEWKALSADEQKNLINKPGILVLKNQRFLIQITPLQAPGEQEGFYVVLSSMEATLSDLQELHQSVYWICFLILGVTLLVGYILARGVTAPLKTLTRTVSRIAEGDYTVKVDIRTGDELETLGNEVNIMASTISKREEEIRNYIKQIEHWNRELESRVAARTKDLEEKNIRLRMISEELGSAYARLDDEFKIVGKLQKRLLPAPSYDQEGIKIRSLYLPNGRAGGDYYDFISPGSEKLFILIADVSGHGTPAAFIMGITRVIAHTLIHHDSSPGEVLQELGQILHSTVSAGEFVTMFLGCLNTSTNELRYSSAGHPAPLLINKNDHTLLELDQAQGLPLGILKKTNYEEKIIPIPSQHRLLLYTDGIVESFSGKRIPYGINRLQDILINHVELSPEDLLDVIMNDLETFLKDTEEIKPLDDVTLVVMDFEKIPLPTVMNPDVWSDSNLKRNK
ncbi:MAG: SpoIIE family protein phosphatase [bacterium]|jgi:serine phosphatase RsbU (regulator of sigma subunit)